MADRVESSGDARRDRFTCLYHDHYTQILGYALRRTSSPDAALDVVADTFLTLWRRLDDTPAAALPWLYTVARNVLANQQRGERRQLRLTARLRTEPAAPAPDPSDTIAAGAAAVTAAFARLRPDDRRLLDLLAVAGLPPVDIARIEGCTAATIRVRLHRARGRFARELARHGVRVQRFPDAGHTPGTAAAHANSEVPR